MLGTFAKLRPVQTPEQQAYFEQQPLPVSRPPKERFYPDNPPWGSAIAVGMWFFSVLLILIIPSMFLGVYMLANNANLADPSSLANALKDDPTAIWVSVIAVLPAHILTLVAGWLVVTQAGKYSFTEMLGWKSGGMRWFHHIGVLLAFMAISMVVGYFVQNQEHELMRMISSSKMTLFTMAFLAVLTAPLIEELVYRGIVYSALQRSVTPWIAVGITTLLFALVHVPQYLGSPATIALLLVLSLVLTVMRMKTENLLPCIIFHTIFNLVQSVLMIAQAYIPTSASPETASAMSMLRSLF